MNVFFRALLAIILAFSTKEIGPVVVLLTLIILFQKTFYTRRYKHKKRGLIGTAEPDDFIAVSQVTADCDNSPTLTVQCGDVSILVPASFDIDQLTTLVKGLR